MLEIRECGSADVPGAAAVWNEVVREGRAFPQTEELTESAAREFFAAQDFTAAAVEDGRVLEWGRTSDLFYHPKHLHTEQFVSSRFL